jgi:Fe-S-cluster containining protein
MEGIFTKKNFQCNRYCGQCCKELVVQVSRSDISRIKGLGFDEKYFVDKDIMYPQKSVLKRTEKGCIFLDKGKDGKYSCRIHPSRPKICRKYPFFKESGVKSCLPKDMFPGKLINIRVKHDY